MSEPTPTTPDGTPLQNRRCTCAYYCLNEITAEGFAVAEQKWCTCACHAKAYAEIIDDRSNP
jgi:hypothetical protein